MTLSFVLCVEAGRLEAQATLLCRSIRRFGGRWADATIRAYSPRPGSGPSRATVDELETQRVEFIDEPLNAEFANYPIGNKIFTCAHAEATGDSEIIVFADSDTVFVAEPVELLLADHRDAAVRPVDRKNRGSAGAGDRHEAYWQRMYELLDVAATPRVETVVDQESIRAYFNAGLVVARRGGGVFQEWKEDFLRLMAAEHVPSSGNLNNMDQFTLAAVLARRIDRVHLLSDRYNYPLGKRPILPDELAGRQLGELVHVHYHRWFHRAGFLESTQPAIDPSDPVVQWLRPQLPLEPQIHDPIRYVETAR